METTSKLLILHIIEFLIANDDQNLDLSEESQDLVRYIGEHYDDEIFNLRLKSMGLNIISKYLVAGSSESVAYINNMIDHYTEIKNLVCKIWVMIPNNETKDLE